ncbi:hypothetical protein [Rhizohabitans arisaemae]|uniref:hypothetical protein n=1 Tax=Rhizohabitans arisaemae TaxID=2720610 RepID=UPI0024B25213|nr:hypothetical protein [Rhizohabitans arisaemae]
MRFPSRILGGNAVFALIGAAALLTICAGAVAVITAFGNTPDSAWEKAAQAVNWYSLMVGISLAQSYLPVYLAHGQTRRRFGAQAAVAIGVFGPLLAALVTAGYLIESGIYRLIGWSQVLTRPHVFDEATQVPLVFLEYLIEFLAWLTAGAFIGSGFYRWGLGGLLTIPVAVGLVVLAEGAIGTELRLPILPHAIGVDVPQSLGTTLGVGLGTFLVGLALTWLIIRDIPVRNPKS